MSNLIFKLHAFPPKAQLSWVKLFRRGKIFQQMGMMRCKRKAESDIILVWVGWAFITSPCKTIRISKSCFNVQHTYFIKDLTFAKEICLRIKLRWNDKQFKANILFKLSFPCWPYVNHICRFFVLRYLVRCPRGKYIIQIHYFRRKNSLRDAKTHWEYLKDVSINGLCLLILNSLYACSYPFGECYFPYTIVIISSSRFYTVDSVQIH